MSNLFYFIWIKLVNFFKPVDSDPPLYPGIIASMFWIPLGGRWARTCRKAADRCRERRKTTEMVDWYWKQRKTTEGAGVRRMTVEDDGSGGSFRKTTEDGGSMYYNRVFGGWAEVMRITMVPIHLRKLRWLIAIRLFLQNIIRQGWSVLTTGWRFSGAMKPLRWLWAYDSGGNFAG